MFIPVILFFFTLAVYLQTLCATFNINDSGETIMVCDLLTVSHSPGYPLHTLWGHVFCLLPLGKPMFRVTFCSAFTGAASVVVLYGIVRLMLKEVFDPAEPSLDGGERKPSAWLWEVPALFGALVFAFSFQHWFQSCGAKGGIYTLNTLLSVGILYLFYKMKETGWFVKSFLLMGFLYGLSLAHHWPNQVAMAPSYLWFLFSGQRKFNFDQLVKKALSIASLVAFALGCFLGFQLTQDFKAVVAMGVLFMVLYLMAEVYGWATWAKGVAACFLSLSTYMYLSIRSTQNPLVNWWNPDNATRLLETVIRKGYQGVGDKRSLETMLRVFDRFMLHAHHQFGDVFSWLVYGLAVWGLYWLYQRRKSSAIGLFLFGGGIFGAITVFNNPLEGYQWTVDNFFTPVYMTTAMLAAAGVAGICEWAAKEWPARATRLYVGALCMAFALTPLLLNGRSSIQVYHDPIPYKGSTDRIFFEGNDQSHYVSSYDEGMNMLKTVTRDGVIICNGDIDILPLWYLQFVEGKRPEVVSFTMQLVPYDWYRNPLFKRWPFLYVPLRRTAYGQDDIRPETVVQDMITQHLKDRSFYYTNIFTAQWLRDPQWLQAHPEDQALPDGFLWRLVGSKGLNYAFTSQRLNWLWDTYRLRDMEPPERGYWDEYTDVMKDSYGIGYDFTGYFALMNHMPDLAVWCFNNALKYRQPQTLVRIYMMLGESYMALGRPAEAINNYQETLKRDPRNPYIFVKIGDAFFMSKDYSDAQSAYQQSLALNPQQRDASDGLLVLNNPSEAVKQFQEALRKNGEKSQQGPYWLTKLGDAYLMLKKNAEARNSYRKALSIDPGQEEAVNGLRLLGGSPN